VYLDDAEDLARTAQVFKGYLGDRSSYAGFVFDGPASDLTWQCNPTRPVGINPARCTRSGTLLDGVLPDDQRRAGSYVWPAPQENYVWEALQGLLAQAVILHRAGYPVWGWEDRALLRASRWLHDVNRFPAANDDTWLPHLDRAMLELQEEGVEKFAESLDALLEAVAKKRERLAVSSA
jgi:hypothetical protein